MDIKFQCFIRTVWPCTLNSPHFISQFWHFDQSFKLQTINIHFFFLKIVRFKMDAVETPHPRTHNQWKQHCLSISINTNFLIRGKFFPGVQSSETGQNSVRSDNQNQLWRSSSRWLPTGSFFIFICTTNADCSVTTLNIPHVLYTLNDIKIGITLTLLFFHSSTYTHLSLLCTYCTGHCYFAVLFLGEQFVVGTTNM